MSNILDILILCRAFTSSRIKKIFAYNLFYCFFSTVQCYILLKITLRDYQSVSIKNWMRAIILLSLTEDGSQTNGIVFSGIGKVRFWIP